MQARELDVLGRHADGSRGVRRLLLRHGLEPGVLCGNRGGDVEDTQEDTGDEVKKGSHSVQEGGRNFI